METVTLKPLHHRGLECIGIYCADNALLNKYLQHNAGAKWSRTKHCWYLPCTKIHYGLLAKALSENAILQNGELKAYLEKKNNTKAAMPANVQQPPPPQQPVKKTGAPAAKQLPRLSAANAEAFRIYRQQLILKAYSPATIRTYSNELLQFLQTIKNRRADEFTVARIKDYLQYCFETLQLSEATLHSRMNALKFYYEQVLYKEKFFWEIPRPKKRQQNPHFFNQDEISQLTKPDR